MKKILNWLGLRRAPVLVEEHFPEDDGGWRQYPTDFNLPPLEMDLWLQFRRPMRPELGLFIGRICDFSVYFQVVNLEWRLTGIARVQLEAKGFARKFLLA